jgi:hypothetical protein
MCCDSTMKLLLYGVCCSYVLLWYLLVQLRSFCVFVRDNWEASVLYCNWLRVICGTTVELLCYVAVWGLSVVLWSNCEASVIRLIVPTPAHLPSVENINNLAEGWTSFERSDKLFIPHLLLSLKHFPPASCSYFYVFQLISFHESRHEVRRRAYGK